MSESPDAVMMGDSPGPGNRVGAAPLPAPALPGLAGRSSAQQQGLMVLLLMLGIALLAAALVLIASAAREMADRTAAIADAQMQVQRMAKAAAQLALGLPTAADELRQGSQAWAASLQSLGALNRDGATAGDATIVPGSLQPLLDVGSALQGLAAATADPQRSASTASAEELDRQSAAVQAGLTDLQQRLRSARVLTPTRVALGLGGAVLLALALAGLLRLFVLEQTRRSREAEAERERAEHQEREARRINDTQQAAILRLMNELQAVSEGDLTRQATVSEDITGAIADSVNYTVEELRSLVSQVQHVVQRVMRTTQQVEHTSLELLAGSAEQLQQIRETGESVLGMATRITDMSRQSQSSAEVARQTLKATDSGLIAAQNAITGMNAIRDQIQETSKRIKRLGESSQEIGEITDLISGITDQTHVLALNAAIQAASGSEAGRGFSLVAEEVQRLAERSSEATRQISALVRAIQSDTQDAVAAMERSTYGVIEGARLTDAAGHALQNIDRVTRQLAEWVEHMSAQTRSDAQAAKVVAANIQHILAVTEQNAAGTQSTAQVVKELSKAADDLRSSVSRFKVQ